MLLTELEKRVVEDKSLLGTLHMIQYHALMLRQKAELDSELSKKAHKIHEIANSAMSLIKPHPNNRGAMMREDLESHLKDIHVQYDQITEFADTFTEVREISRYLKISCNLSLGTAII